jgi:hypothetical protein
MSSTVLTIGGAFNGATGIVSVPSSLLFGQASVGGTLNAQIQAYLGTITDGLANGTVDFQNSDLAAGTGGILAGSVGGGGSFEEFTNVTADSTGASSAGSGSYPGEVVTNGVTSLVVQTPGNVTLTGVATTTNAIFGADSNVNYTVSADTTPGTIYLAGGANSISLLSAGTDVNQESIYSAGQDTINLFGQGTDFVTVLGNATIQDFSANATVTAEGNATTSLSWDGANAGGSLVFINNSTAAGKIEIGIFNGVASKTSVTVSGGAGGGFYVGGSSGHNSLIGGTGAVTLVGGGSGDILEASSSGSNFLAQGQGPETLLAASSTVDNLFGAGLIYPGLGNPAVSGVISTAGSGNQTFFLGNVPGGETVYGSTASTANNGYFIVSGTIQGSVVGGGLYSIYNFTGANSTILLSNGFGGAGSASVTSSYVDQGHSDQYDINLSDGTVIELKGLSTSQIAGIHAFQQGSVTGIAG